MSPDTKCVCFVLVYLCTFAIAQPHRNHTEVHLSQEWKPGVGWVVTCSWDLVPNDRLQSVALHRNEQHFVNYRPGKWKPEVGWVVMVTCSWDLVPNDSLQYATLHRNEQHIVNYRPGPKFNGPSLRHIFETTDDNMELSCEESTAKCTLVIEPVHPPKEDIDILCEVSGEGPMFRVGKRNLLIQTVVPPSDAILEASRATENANPVLNCSATGVPAPKIEWSVSDEDTKISSFHSSRVWNVTSKLWDAWSTFMPASDQLPVRCTAKVLRGNTQYASKTAEYNAARRIEIRLLDVILATITLVLIR